MRMQLVFGNRQRCSGEYHGRKLVLDGHLLRIPAGLPRSPEAASPGRRIL